MKILLQHLRTSEWKQITTSSCTFAVELYSKRAAKLRSHDIEVRMNGWINERTLLKVRQSRIGRLNWAWIPYSRTFHILEETCRASPCHSISISVDCSSLCGKMIVMNLDGNVVTHGLVRLVQIDWKCQNMGGPVRVLTKARSCGIKNPWQSYGQGCWHIDRKFRTVNAFACTGTCDFYRDE